MRVLTVEDVGNAFEQALEADDNGGVFMVFPNIPVVKFPEMNQLFIFPLIAYAKLVSICRPEWKRMNGIYGEEIFGTRYEVCVSVHRTVGGFAHAHIR